MAVCGRAETAGAVLARRLKAPAAGGPAGHGLLQSPRNLNASDHRRLVAYDSDSTGPRTRPGPGRRATGSVLVAMPALVSRAWPSVPPRTCQRLGRPPPARLGRRTGVPPKPSPGIFRVGRAAPGRPHVSSRRGLRSAQGEGAGGRGQAHGSNSRGSAAVFTEKADGAPDSRCGARRRPSR